MSTLAWIVLGGLLMSAIALVGSFTLLLPRAALERMLLPLVSVAAGTLLGGAFFHMLPTGLASLGAIEAGVWLLAGFTVFLGLEQFLHWHHAHAPTQEYRKPMAYLILIGDGVHNFLGGLGIASTFLINPQAGITAWFAAAAHEVPQELGDFGILLHGGMRRSRALALNFVSGLMFLLGALAAYGLSLDFHVGGLILFGAGNFIYIAASDLIPEFKAHAGWGRGVLNFSCFVGGIALMWLLASRFHA